MKMCLNTLLYPLFCKISLVLASILLDHCQRLYIWMQLRLLDQQLGQEILFVSLKVKDISFQPGKLTDNTLT